MCHGASDASSSRYEVRPRDINGAVEPGVISRAPGTYPLFRHSAGVAKSALEQGAEKIFGGNGKFFLGYSAAGFTRKPSDLHERVRREGARGGSDNKVVF